MNSKILRFILHLFFPNRCPVCNTFINYMDDFCEACKRNLPIYNGNCSIDNAELFIAAFWYDSQLKNAIILLKNGTCGNSAFALGKALADKIKSDFPAFSADIIIPVPMLKTDKFKRGYNQSELLSAEISYRLKIPYNKKIIIKNRKTSPQKSLSQKERMTNLKGAFSIIAPELICGKRIIIIDDVCTTGSTLSEISKLLKNNGASEILCACCCKTRNLTDEI